MLKTHLAKFLKLVANDQLIPSLKTFSDTVLFYYLGRLACNHAVGNLFEIGAGGSTYPLLELSDDFQKKFILVDINKSVVESLLTQDILQHFAQANISIDHSDSSTLTAVDSELAYCHIDGSKNYHIALHDLELCTANLGKNGLICQDDYGNNKWSTVTDAVHAMIGQGQLQMLAVGDSSAWLTKPEYYNSWINALHADAEFNTLVPFLNLVDSSVQEKYPSYFFMQSLLTKRPDSVTADVFNYYDQLLDFNSDKYLKMPYAEQSTPGYQFRRKPNGFALETNWQELRGDSWPKYPPQTREEIDQLPEYIKNELVNLHHINDLYAQVASSISPRCIRT